jgi:outer membrane protein insertion porin family
VVKLTYYLSFYLLLTLVSCNQFRYLKKDEFLLSHNSIKIKGDKELQEDISSIIRQKPNRKFIGLPIYLWAYNSVDSLKIASKQLDQLQKIRNRNHKKSVKQNRINQRRIDRARKKSKSDYKFKEITLVDTLNIKLSFSQWFKTKFGEPPVIFDSLYFNKSTDQLRIFLKKKGYYDSEVLSNLKYNNKKTKVRANYIINTGECYKIDTLRINNQDSLLTSIYWQFRKQKTLITLKNAPFDSDRLIEFRKDLANYIVGQGVYGFSSDNILFVADTNRQTKKVSIQLEFTKRILKNLTDNSSIKEVSFTKHHIKSVSFHIIDTTYVFGSFKQTVESQGLGLFVNGFLRTIDTLRYHPNIELSKSHKKVERNRDIIITYNQRLPVEAKLLEYTNLVETNSLYNEKAIQESVQKLNGLGLFQYVKSVLIENKDSLDIHYYLIPSNNKVFSFSPKVTTSGLLLGVSGTANYKNLNLFGSGERLNLSFTGGFQSMPNLNYQSTEVTVQDNVKQAFNTFEIGPSLKMEIPGVFPFPLDYFSKQRNTHTIFSSSFGFQKRNVFTKQAFKFNYLYSIGVGKNKEIQFGLPGISSINFINFLSFDANFADQILKNNDPFTRNYYTNQLNWQDLKFIYQYSSLSDDKKKKHYVFHKLSFDLAGNLLSLFGRTSLNSLNNQKTIIGIPYSQFARIDNELIYSYQIKEYSSVHLRTIVGAGIPYANSKLSLPFDYSFFGGGPNDIRAWRAGTLGPGTYNYYLDSNYSNLQLGDIRIGFSSEFRFKITSVLRGAFFIDAANIWTVNKDINRIGSQFTSSWYKELAVGSGVGLRADFDYFVIRLDFGVKLKNPSLSEGNRWFFQPKDEIVYKKIQDNPGAYTSPFFPENWNDFINSFRLGIGYPF